MSVPPSGEPDASPRLITVSVRMVNRVCWQAGRHVSLNISHLRCFRYTTSLGVGTRGWRVSSRLVVVSAGPTFRTRGTGGVQGGRREEDQHHTH